MLRTSRWPASGTEMVSRTCAMTKLPLLFRHRLNLALAVCNGINSIRHNPKHGGAAMRGVQKTRLRANANSPVKSIPASHSIVMFGNQVFFEPGSDPLHDD